jgi:hypothetical protein
MGDSMPPPATFDLVDSFARRRGADVEIVLADPQTETTSGAVSVRLAQGERAVEARAELEDAPAGRRLTVRAPRSEVADGIWTLELSSASGPQQLAARLLVQGERPLVLLWGAKAGRTRLPDVKGLAARKRKAAHVGGQVLDRALAVLPEEKRRALRAQARTTARRVLG